MKHRAKTAVRPVPASPQLVRALRWHIAHGYAPDGRLLVHVLPEVYDKCIEGQDEAARRLIEKELETRTN